ncbi:MAG: imidazole glycerol phosphate synthase subunit HisH [Gammaproteobacteria bacterium]|jgi:glutamine amidotransferase|nr:imidazole glycerol phosphate synthase subunit HisH [Chromatiales bacterium]MCP4924863.1 imidazole glycerol phosphate synthase subunit HisH [Gammaproteobacteria bacterium]MDP7093821.1 imidazole glycerol phosphate synthase subunit HisH [Gammaproteobacteria bacterium]MDP7296237.1 imidazole glycerol phosphate synthase subunit HisH [Gammaproteobacteria bacterium]MDP7418551.1 imidazole glycerol phosphate synthase subunit HisH [Gammaproteobacteria bacterium]
MGTPTVAIIDSGGANIASLEYALARLGITGQLTVDADTITAASHVILPGVGAAADSMVRLRKAGLIDLIPALSQPFLGICLGLQLLFSASEEDDTRCLGIFPGTARIFVPTPERAVPHMGWNQITRTRNSDLLHGIPDSSHFYFVHSYAVGVTDDTLALAEYGIPFTAIVERGNFSATQFHPERSGKFGARLLKNFLNR